VSSASIKHFLEIQDVIKVSKFHFLKIQDGGGCHLGKYTKGYISANS